MNSGTLHRRSDWDLDTPVDEAGDWKRFAACLDQWALFTGYLPKQYAEQAEAIRICLTECPVLSECAKFTAQFPDTTGVVQAGIAWEGGRPNPATARLGRRTRRAPLTGDRDGR